MKKVPIDGFLSADEVDAIHFGGPIPLYYQVYLLIRDRILDGRLSQNDVLPSEADITALLGTSRITVRRAFEELVNDGFVRRERGVGTYVVFKTPSKECRDRIEIESLVFREKPFFSEVVLESKMIDPRVDYAPVPLGDKASSSAVYVRRLGRNSRHRPIALVDSWTLCRNEKVGTDVLANLPIETVLSKCGIRVTRSTCEYAAVNATHDVSRLLKMDRNTPLLQICKSSYEDIDSLVRYSRFEFDSQRATCESECPGQCVSASSRKKLKVT